MPDKDWLSFYLENYEKLAVPMKTLIQKDFRKAMRMSVLLTVCDKIDTPPPKVCYDTITLRESLLEYVPHSIDIEHISQQQNNTPKTIVIRRTKHDGNIAKKSFFSRTSRSSDTRLLREEIIKLTRKEENGDELESFEIDRYINHLNKINRQNEEQKTMILSVHFYVAALRHIPQNEETSEVLAANHITKTVGEIGNMTERGPLLLPYSIENHKRWKLYDPNSLFEADFNNISKVHIYTLTQIMITKTQH